LGNLKDEVSNLDKSVLKKNNEITDSESLIKKYEEQQKNVRNNREFDSLSKEIEYQNLEIELYNKKIKEFNFQIDEKKVVITESETILSDRQADLDNKKSELDEIISDTQKEEEGLYKKSDKIQAVIEDRLLTAYKRIRSNARNGLAVVSIQRDACGGCFNQIPPQKKLSSANIAEESLLMMKLSVRVIYRNNIIEKKPV
jgi:predicted  nucleic acid-binding Zn-ribbon protein